MKSLLFKAVNSSVETVFRYETEDCLKEQLKAKVKAGEILVQDKKDILKYLATGYHHIAINRSTVFEVIDVDVEPGVDSPVAGLPNGKRSHTGKRAKRKSA